MTYIKLIIDFFIVGILSFGGSYASIPLIKDVASNYEIISDDMLMNFIAIAESTPGPIAVNLASFVGTYVGGILGAILVTLAEILPAFLIILIFTIFFKDLLKNEKVSYALSIIRPCIIGIIVSVGTYLLCSIVGKAITNIVAGLKGLEFLSRELIVGDTHERYQKYMDLVGGGLSTIIIAVFLLIIMLLYNRFTKKKLSAIKIIIIGAILGIAINYLL